MTTLDLTIIPKRLDDLLDRTHDRRHRAILENYRRHVLLEVSGRWQEILPDLVVEHPVYKTIAGGQTIVLDGLEQVESFYRTLTDSGACVSVSVEERIAAADWGLATESSYLQVLPGSALAAIGIPVEDPNATYELRTQVANIWPYDKRALLIGEHVYANLAALAVTPGDPADVISVERAAEILAPYLD